MYGEKGLPGNPTSRFGIHPAWWQPDATGIETRVSIEFQADGSSRHHTTTDNDTFLYRLDRTVKTIGLNTSKDDEPDFRRIEERASLMVRELDGTWGPHEMGPEAVIEELLPWSLRDFFVMDTDKATDFVGGSENKTIRRQEVQEKTTGAITSLLGIDVFRSAKDRVQRIAHDFSKKATKAIGDHDLNELQADLDDARATHQKVKEKIKEEVAREAELSDKRDQLDDDLETELRKSGSHDELNEKLRANRKRYERAVKDRSDCAAQVAEDLESIDLLAPLASSAICHTYDFLKPLHDQGKIPLAHIPFVRSLMKTGCCVCGQVLLEDNEHGLNVQQRIEEAAEEAERADFLDQLHNAARSLVVTTRDVVPIGMGWG